MTRDEIMAISEREMDAAVTEMVFELKLNDCYGVPRSGYRLGPGNTGPVAPLRDYCSEADDCLRMEQKIGRRGLSSEYVHALSQLTTGYVSRAIGVPWSGAGWEWNAQDVFMMMTAPLDTKCRAALLAVMDTEEKQNAD